MPQSLAKVYIHIIFSTKHHTALITREIKGELHAYIAGTLINLKSEVLKINGTEDHIHILCTLPRTITIAKLLEEIKKSSSKWMKTKGSKWLKFAWQNGYGCFSVSGSSIQNLINYIEKQEEHHKKISFRDEFIEFLKKNNIDYDERYLWD